MNPKRDISFVDILTKFENDEKSFRIIRPIIESFLKENLPSLEILPQITSRIKDPISLYKKLIKKGIKYEDVHDILGFRIICHFPSEVDRVNQFIEKNFIVEHFEKKSDKLKFDQLGYTSDHFEVRIKPEIELFSELSEFSSLIFELQVRTLCQHTWADIEHALLYKQDMPLEESLKRRVFRLTSLLEICDQEFETVNNKLVSHTDYKVFATLKKLEGKYFKYAKRDYDKETSIVFLSTLSSLINDIDEYLNKLICFIDNNDLKLNQIFLERVAELDRNLYFSQPEIFLIWYYIENDKYFLISEWQKYYDTNDLQELAVWWGTPLNIP